MASIDLNAANARTTDDPDDRTWREGFIRDEHLETYERWLDTKFSVGGMRFGLDGVIGLIPGVGDLLTTGVSGLFVLDAWRSGARKRAIARMLGNIGVDLTLGSIPVVGDLFDFAFKSNVKNLRLLKQEREHLRREHAARHAR